MGRLIGHKILVTGASSGIGRSISILLAQMGANLVLTGRDKKRLYDTLNSLPGSGHKMLTADLTDIIELNELFNQSTIDGKKLTGLVHSAGIMPVLPLRILNRSFIKECMDINFSTFIELVRQYAEMGHGDNGCIIGISSIAAVQPEMGQISYSASKAAMNAAVYCLAQELWDRKIRINTIMPGVTGLSSSVSKSSEALIRRQIMGLESPDDIASICAYLLSSEAGMITGRAVYIDGGRFL